MGILDNAKDIAELVKKYNDQDLYQRIVDLRAEILELREENLRLREELNELQKATDISNELIREGNAYYRESEDGQKLGPFCMACWDYDSKLVNVNVHRTTIQGRTHISYRCAICSTRKGN